MPGSVCGLFVCLLSLKTHTWTHADHWKFSKRSFRDSY